MKMRFDHTYTPDQKHKFWHKLEKSGFLLDKNPVEHPGKTFCKFIMISVKREGKSVKLNYLEFVHMGKGGKKRNEVGFSAAAGEPLKKASLKLTRSKTPNSYVHKNYDWKENSKDLLPGWNFVSFTKHKSKIYTWLTEYEPRPRKNKKKLKSIVHPNGVYKTLGFEMILSKEDLKLYSVLLGKPKNNRFKMQCGTLIEYSLGKTSQIKAVVLETKDLAKMVSKFKWDEPAYALGQLGVRIKNPTKKMWDVIVV